MIWISYGPKHVLWHCSSGTLITVLNHYRMLRRSYYMFLYPFLESRVAYDQVVIWSVFWSQNALTKVISSDQLITTTISSLYQLWHKHSDLERVWPNWERKGNRESLKSTLIRSGVKGWNDFCVEFQNTRDCENESENGRFTRGEYLAHYESDIWGYQTWMTWK
jgi:hypothetical protein